MECLLSFGNRNGIQGRLVLILILMECLLRKNTTIMETTKQSLNPYSNGMLT